MPAGVPSAGSELALSSAGPADPTVQANWEGLTWVVWEEATSLGEIGVTADETTYTPVKSGEKVKLSTTIDNGEIPAEGPFDPTDPAIILLKAATDSRPIAPVWCRLTDSKGEVQYFKGNPKNFRKKIGTATDILMVMANVSVSGAIFTVAAP